MKVVLKMVGGILASSTLLLVALRVTGLNPHDRIPSLRLTGDLVTTPLADWSFTDQVPSIKLQTQSRFLLPHAVTINCVACNGSFYVTSTYPAGQPRSWNVNVMRDPHARIKIGDKLYDRRLVIVTDPAERQGLLEAKTKKYPQLETPANATANVFRVVG